MIAYSMILWPCLGTKSLGGAPSLPLSRLCSAAPMAAVTSASYHSLGRRAVSVVRVLLVQPPNVLP